MSLPNPKKITEQFAGKSFGWKMNNMNCKSLIQRGHLYCNNPYAITISAILAVTSWHIYRENGTRSFFEKPLSSVVIIGFFSFVYGGIATIISDCVPAMTKPIIPLLLVGSSAYYIGSTYVGNRIEYADHKWKIEIK